MKLNHQKWLALAIMLGGPLLLAGMLLAAQRPDIFAGWPMRVLILLAFLILIALKRYRWDVFARGQLVSRSQGRNTAMKHKLQKWLAWGIMLSGAAVVAAMPRGSQPDISTLLQQFVLANALVWGGFLLLVRVVKSSRT